MFPHPFLWIGESSRKSVFWMFTGFAVLTMIALQVLGGPLRTDASPTGIVSYELAGNLPAVERILGSWDLVARVYAALNLGLDYLFIGAYVGAIGLGCALMAGGIGRNNRLLGVMGVSLSWAMLLAGALDCVENYALIRLLLGSRESAFAALARFCAVPKFIVVLLGLLYVGVGLVSLIFLRRRAPTQGRG